MYKNKNGNYSEVQCMVDAETYVISTVSGVVHVGLEVNVHLQFISAKLEGLEEKFKHKAD